MNKLFSVTTKKIIIFIVIISFFLFIGTVANAATSSRCGETVAKPLQFTFNVPLPGFKDGASTIEIDCLTLGDYITYIYKFVIGMTGLLSVFMITLGAITWIFAGGNSGSVNKAKQYITGAVTGILLALSSFSILYIINPQLVEIRPVKIPIASKAMLPICEYSGTKTEDQQKRVFVLEKDGGSATDAKNTWCGQGYVIKDADSKSMCHGFDCDYSGDNSSNKNVFCSPNINSSEPLEIAKAISTFGDYVCKKKEDAVKAVIYGCNNSNIEANCERFNVLASAYATIDNVFTKNEKCVWQNYGWSTALSSDTCRWCPETYYAKMDAIFSANTAGVCSKLHNPSNNAANSENSGICPDCDDPLIGHNTVNKDEYEHKRTENACITLLYPKYCK